MASAPDPNLEIRDAGPADLPPATWNDTAREYPDLLLHEAFEAMVRSRPGAPALRFRDETLDYGELDRRVNQLSHELIERGAGPGTLVAVCMDRSVEMVVALYAVLKSGAAYVPIDPEYPSERIDFMLEDTAAPIVLTQSWHAARVHRDGSVVLSTDGAAADIARQPASSPGTIAAADDLAYVIYTSGSTGRPKGAMISHRAIANRIYWMQDHFGLTGDDRVLQKTPFSFDVSVWEFFWPLLFGAQLEVAEPGGHRDTGYLVRTIVEREITTLHFVPSMLQLFLEDPGVGRCTSLRRVVCSGEALPKALQDRFFDRLDAELHNLYGPTEAAVDVTAWACDAGSELTFVPIGRPVANTSIHLLDETMRAVPLGAVGELYIGGIQVGRGYLNRPELTAERFVPDPAHPGDTLYRTGDLARYLPDGAIEFLGRTDFQVKIRGFRVEMGEIEAALEAVDGVRQAVVVAHERPSGDQELVAYVSPREGSELRTEALQARLGARLPDYMVPTTFIVMERFELTSNGKVDRKALPAPTRVRPASGPAFATPRGALEHAVADSWRRLLDLDRVGRDDRFFELGGTSLQAARFVNQMQSLLGESIFVVTLFDAPSVADYAALLERQYPAAVARAFGTTPSQPGTQVSGTSIEASDLERFRSVVPVSGSLASGDDPPNPRAIFILSPPRSGTTLLRIMLAGHPGLFAASELQLLGFDTMAARAAAYSGRFSNWLDGLVRAVMELEGVEAGSAKDRIAEAERQGLTTKHFFRRLQDACAPRLLVDKSPSYALDPAALRQAEHEFDGAFYIHLVREPGAMIDSFARHHMEQVLYLRDHPFDARQLAELVWTVSHDNILEFLATVPPTRQHRIGYERLVRDPSGQMETLCQALGLPFDPAVTDPYDALETKMVDGVYAESAPMGDPNFLGRGRIDPSLAQPRSFDDAPALGRPTQALAEKLGYGSATSGSTAPRRRRSALTGQRDRRRAARRS